MAALSETIGAIRYWTRDGSTAEPHPLRLNESRIREADEAWVPEVTPDGPAVLVWFDSN
ncbi:DUF6210 family protein [Streptomyces sp. NPDC001857]|uniref:DUF6210 family protein n=1 Tax=Streptomyces sp. NPDC001857 TaxID=3154400 RepID=UPI003325FC99